MSTRVDTITWSTRCALLSGFMFEVSVRPGSAKPGNVRTNWTGTTSFQADYCHSSSGNADSTGDWLWLTCSTWWSAQPLEGAAVPAGQGCSRVSQRTGTHFPSLSENRGDSSHFKCAGPSIKQQVCQTSKWFEGCWCFLCALVREKLTVLVHK